MTIPVVPSTQDDEPPDVTAGGYSDPAGAPPGIHCLAARREHLVTPLLATARLSETPHGRAPWRHDLKVAIPKTIR